MGEFCILAESILPGFILKKMRVDEEYLVVCLHDQCNAEDKHVAKGPMKCPGEKLPEIYKFVNDYLKKYFKIAVDDKE